MQKLSPKKIDGFLNDPGMAEKKFEEAARRFKAEAVKTAPKQQRYGIVPVEVRVRALALSCFMKDSEVSALLGGISSTAISNWRAKLAGPRLNRKRRGGASKAAAVAAGFKPAGFEPAGVTGWVAKIFRMFAK